MDEIKAEIENILKDIDLEKIEFLNDDGTKRDI